MKNDTKERLIAFCLVPIVILAFWIVATVLLGAINAMPQELPPPKKECDHTSDSFERFAMIRFLPPATITSYNAAEAKIYYKVDTAKEIRLGSFDIEKDTVFDQNLADGKTYVFLIYCARDLHLYGVSKVNKDQIKKAPQSRGNRRN